MVRLASSVSTMKTADKIENGRIAVEDLIIALEGVIDRANTAIIVRPAAQTHEESHELFQIQYAIVNTSTTASELKAQLLKAVGLKPLTRLTKMPRIRFLSQETA